MFYWLLAAPALLLLLQRLLHALSPRPGPALAGRTVFITGCDTGFGYSLALWCADKGMRVLAGCLQRAGEGRRVLGQFTITRL